MVTNGPFWASTQGSVRAGWDFLVWVYEYFVNGRKPEAGPIRLGSRRGYRRGNLTELIKYWFGGQAPSIDITRRWSGTWQVWRDFRPSVCSEGGNWKDPVPSLQDLLDSLG